MVTPCYCIYSEIDMYTKRSPHRCATDWWIRQLHKCGWAGLQSPTFNRELPFPQLPPPSISAILTTIPICLALF